MSPDPILMRLILRKLAREFPSFVEISVHAVLDTPECHRTLFYLAEKNLVEPGAISKRPGQRREMLEAKITALGLDWLQNQGVASTEYFENAGPFELEALRHFLKQALDNSEIDSDVRGDAVAKLMTLRRADQSTRSASAASQRRATGRACGTHHQGRCIRCLLTSVRADAYQRDLVCL